MLWCGFSFLFNIPENSVIATQGTYPGSLKWYAQLNFRSPEGVVQGSKMEGARPAMDISPMKINPYFGVQWGLF